MSTLVVGSTFGQLKSAVNHFNDNGSFGKAPSANMEKALGTTVWSNDFSNAADWTVDNASQTTPFGWNIGTTVNSWWSGFSGGMTSTSGGNVAEVYNGNYNNDDQAINVTYTLTTATPIDVTTLTSGSNLVLLEFEQYGAKFNDLQEVQVSVDGVTYTTVYDNNDKTTFVGNNPSAYYANPEKISVNISDEIASAPNNVTIRFSWTSNFPSDPALGAWTTFGWFIDDVALVTLPDNDLQVSGSIWGSAGNGVFNHYYKLPETQIAPITFANFVTNGGNNEAKNVLLSVDVNSGTYNGTSAAGVDLAAGVTDSTIEVETPFTPSGAGTYSFTWTLTSDSTDDVMANNTLVGDSFEVGGDIYQRDNGTMSGSFSQGEDAHSIGNTFDIYANQDLYSIDFVVGNGSDAGSTVLVKLYEVTYAQNAPATYAEVDASSEYNITASDVSSNATISLHLSSAPYALEAGKTYEAVVETYGGAGTKFAVATAGSSRPGTSHVYTENTQGALTWFYVTSTPMVRMNMSDYGVSIKENSEVTFVNNYPNPFTSTTTVNFSLANASNVSIEVTDVTGKIINSNNLGNLTTGVHTAIINANELSSGIYYYSVITDNSKITNKMIVQK